MIFRQLEKSDFHKNYLQLLSQLTEVGTITEEQFNNIYDNLQSTVWVYEDNGEIVASASLLVEQKFIHNGGAVGHLEDVVVNQNYRGHSLGQKIVKEIVQIAREKGCYKIIADCKHNLLGFYAKNGFEKKGEQIAIYFT